jgi:hypothetical protein
MRGGLFICMLQCMSLFLARNRHGWTGRRCPFMGAKQTSRLQAGDSFSAAVHRGNKCGDKQPMQSISTVGLDIAKSVFRSVLREEFGLRMTDEEIRACIEVMERKGEKGAPHPFFA